MPFLAEAALPGGEKEGSQKAVLLLWGLGSGGGGLLIELRMDTFRRTEIILSWLQLGSLCGEPVESVLGPHSELWASSGNGVETA